MKQAYDFLYCLAGLIAGIYIQYLDPLPDTFLLCLAFAGLILAGCCFKINTHFLRLKTSILWCFIIGQTVFSIHAHLLKKEQQALSGHYLYLTGLITDTHHLAHPLYAERLTMILEGGKYKKLPTGRRLHSTVQVYSKTVSGATIGDKVLLKNISLKPMPSHFTEADISLAKEGIAATLFTSSPFQLRILEKESSGVRAWLWQWRQAIYQRFSDKLSPLTTAYSGLLFFGNKQHQQTTALQDNFAYWGLSHYLARSGLHIVLLIAMWFMILRFFPIHIRLKNLFLCFFILSYAFCSWESTSFLRALFVFLLAQTSVWLGRETKTLHLLTLVCMGMILYNPFLIFYLDFQLTFGLTFGLLTFSKYLTA